MNNKIEKAKLFMSGEYARICHSIKGKKKNGEYLDIFDPDKLGTTKDNLTNTKSLWRRLNNQAYRIFNKLWYLLRQGYKPKFITITISKNTDINYQSYITRFLKENTLFFMGLKDFGKNNGQIHFHMIVLFKNETLYKHRQYNSKKNKWDTYLTPQWVFELEDKFGWVYVESIRNTFDDAKRLSKYIVKVKNVLSILESPSIISMRNCSIFKDIDNDNYNDNIDTVIEEHNIKLSISNYINVVHYQVTKAILNLKQIIFYKLKERLRWTSQ